MMSLAESNRLWVRLRIAEKGWDESVDREAEYLIELALDRIRREERSNVSS